MTDPPPSAPRPAVWRGVGVTLAGYAVTLALLQALTVSRGSARAAWTPDAVLSLTCAALLVTCTLWLIRLQHSLRTELTVALVVSMGLLADLLALQGLSVLHGAARPDPVQLLLGASCAASLVVLTVRGNVASRLGQRHLQQVQETDVLTGVLNRRGVLRQYVAIPPGAEVNVALLDVNDLRRLNEKDGHDAGDAYLRAIADLLRALLPREAVLGRWGGDEFMVLSPRPLRALPLLDDPRLRALRRDPDLPVLAVGEVSVPAGGPLERVVALASEQMYAQKARDYAARAAQRQGLHVDLNAFPRYLQTLETLDDILRLGLRRAADLAGFEAWYFIRHGDPLEITYQDALHGDAPDTLTSRPIRIVDAVVNGQETVFASDYERSEHAEPFWVRAGIKSVIAAPVCVNGEVTCVLAFTSRRGWPTITPGTRRLLEGVAVHLGHHLERQDAYARMQASVEAGITGMGIILEARDLETAGHTARVVSAALRLGRAAGLDDEELGALRLGAYLHDVGKLAIPDAVLLKPGPLTDAEWTLMRSHAERGALMAARLPSVPEGSLQVVRSHHERWDGGGYPDGLAGEGIPRLARIFSVCDVYDALTSGRPYKDAWTHEAAVAELLAQRGLQFDPALTDLFLEAVQPGLSGTRRSDRVERQAAS